ncbi:hypothetical protein LINPERPRIM_LOCUS25781 [Linum perenne]
MSLTSLYPNSEADFIPSQVTFVHLLLEGVDASTVLLPNNQQMTTLLEKEAVRRGELGEEVEGPKAMEVEVEEKTRVLLKKQPPQRRTQEST